MEVSIIQNLIESNYNMKNVRIVDAPQGASNSTHFVLVGNQKYVLRIYNNNKIESVIKEHFIISKLRECKFVYGTPNFLSTVTGKTFVHSEGVLLALYPFIPGQPFKRGQIHEFGKTVGCSISFFKSIAMEELPQTGNSLYELFLKSTSVDQVTVYDKLISAPLCFSKEDARVLTEEMEIQARLIKRYSQMPRQLIHGDLTRLNVLFYPEKEEVSGILDFELADVSIKTIEAATSLTSILRIKYLEEEDMFVRVDEFISGYTRYESLSPVEIELLPRLILLRLASISWFHLNRFSENPLNDYIFRYYPYYLAWKRWIDLHSDRLQHICNKYL